MNKRFYLFIVVVIAAMFLAATNSKAGELREQPQEAQNTPIPEAAALIVEAQEFSQSLTQKWIASLGHGDWLYVSSVYETSQELGVDPETGWPIPQKALWEYWSQLDADGQQLAAITKRTDLETGRVTYAIRDRTSLLRLPSNVRETVEPGSGFETFRPIWDHHCNTRLHGLVNAPSEGVASTVLLEELVDEGRWKLSIHISHPRTDNVSGFFGSFTGYELNCYRDVADGSVIRVEEFLISEEGEKVLLGLDYNYHVEWLQELPSDIQMLLDQLRK